jgi:hypothetical protein
MSDTSLPAPKPKAVVRPTFRPQPPMVLTIEIPAECAPAVKAALDELQNTLGHRGAGAFPYPQEDALVRAIRGLGPIRRALSEVAADAHYVWE